MNGAQGELRSGVVQGPEMRLMREMANTYDAGQRLSEAAAARVQLFALLKVVGRDVVGRCRLTLL